MTFEDLAYTAKSAPSLGEAPRPGVGRLHAARLAARHRSVGRSTQRRGRRVRLLWQVGLIAAWLLTWEAAYRLEVMRPLLLRSPGDVRAAFMQMARQDQIWPNVFSTLQAVVIAVLLSIVVGVGAGLALALTPRVERVLMPFLNALNSSPRIALAPVFIIAFGIGTASKVALACSVVIFVLLHAARAGVHAADVDTVRLMTVMGATKKQVFLKLLLPVSLPSILSGIHLAIIYSLLVVVTSEMIAARSGMGLVVAQYSSTFQLDFVYAAILILIAMGTVLNRLAAELEHRVLWWKSPDDFNAVV